MDAHPIEPMPARWAAPVAGCRAWPASRVGRITRRRTRCRASGDPMAAGRPRCRSSGVGGGDQWLPVACRGIRARRSDRSGAPRRPGWERRHRAGEGRRHLRRRPPRWRPPSAGGRSGVRPARCSRPTARARVPATDRRLTDGSALMVADADGTNPVQIVPAQRSGRVDVELRAGWPIGRRRHEHRLRREPRRHRPPLDPRRHPPCWTSTCPAARRSFMSRGVPGFPPTNPQEILVKAQPDVQPVRPGCTCTTLQRGASGRSWSRPTMCRMTSRGSPTGEHIIYRGVDNDPHVVAADGSVTIPSTPRRDQISPWSNDGTRVVVDLAEVDVPGDDSINAGGRPDRRVRGIRPAGLRPWTTIECAESWIWSPDDSIAHRTLGPVTATQDTFLQADPTTGQVTELDWVLYRTPTWQRVAP